MSGLHHVTARHSPPHMRKSAAIKAARCAPPVSQKIFQRGHKARKQVREEEKEEDDDDPLDFGDGDEMTTSFLQYCAMCDKQILVPNSSFLYCSEHCRKLDAIPSSANTYASISFSGTTSRTEKHATIFDPYGHYLPRLKPTPRHPNDPRIPPKFHQGKSDLDPTEWKPAEPSPTEVNDSGHRKVKASHDTKSSKTSSRRPGMHDREPSEAHLYLSKYHTTSVPSDSAIKRRPATGRTTPSLSHTSTASSPCSSESGLPGTPYSFVSAPQPGIPKVSITTAPSTGFASGALMEKLTLDRVKQADKRGFQKENVDVTDTPARGSLKKLLGSGGRK